MNEAQTGEKPLRKFTFRFVLDYIWLHLAHGIVFNDGIHHHTFIRPSFSYYFTTCVNSTDKPEHKRKTISNYTDYSFAHCYVFFLIPFLFILL